MRESATNGEGATGTDAMIHRLESTLQEAEGTSPLQELPVATFSLSRTLAAMCLLGVLGAIAVLKPFPQGVHASDIRYVQVPQGPAGVGELPIHNGANRIDSSNQQHGDGYNSLGELVSTRLTLRIELHGDELLYTMLDAEGQTLATRMTREQLLSLYPTLDLDSLMAGADGLRLMQATERTID